MVEVTSPYKGRLTERVAIVTGGSSGIGQATCMALAREGASVVIVGRTSERVADVQARVEGVGGRGSALGLVLDVRREEDMQAMTDLTLARFGQVDILVGCAGIGRSSDSKDRLMPYPVAQMPIHDWDEVIDTNLTGIFLSNRAVLPPMIRQQRGTIINLSSAQAGQYGFPFLSAYCASKFGVIGFSKSLADEVQEFGIKVQVVLPDVTDTPMLGEGDASAVFGKALPPARVGDFIVHILCLPDDTVLLNPIIAPFGNQMGRMQRWRS